MKQLYFPVLILTVTLACAALAAAKAEEPLQAALSQSKWNAYTVVTEAHDGTLYAGVAANPAGQAIFVIAQPENGTVALSVCYEKLIPAGTDLSVLQVDVDGTNQTHTHPYASLTLSASGERPAQFVTFIQDENNLWRFHHLTGVIDGKTYFVDPDFQKNSLGFTCVESAAGANVGLDALDMTPEGLSISTALQTAVSEIAWAQAQRNSELLSLLRVQFPSASWSDAEVADSGRWLDGDDFVRLAIIDRPETRTVYFVDWRGSALLTFESDDLVPFAASRDSLGTYIPFDYGNASDGTVYLYFSLGETSYTVKISISLPNRITVSSLTVVQNEEDRLSADIFGDYLRFRLKSYRLEYVYRPLDPPMQSIQTFDPLQVNDILQTAYSDFAAGNAPYIPAFEDEYALPQPCGAELIPGVYEVYSGPGKQYYREADGKACVSTNDWVQVFGRDGGWALIQYRVEGNLLRFGYIEKEAFRDFAQVPELRFDFATLWQDNQFVTSNPLGFGGDIPLSGGRVSMRRLATLDDCWVYAELTLPDGTPARMFAETVPSHG